jgi:hypothetical protein
MDGRGAEAPGDPCSSASRGGPCRPVLRPATPPDRPDEALLFLGDDEAGSPLEVVGVELADGRLRVIHAMPMRAGYRDLYEEATKWRQ